MTSGSVVGTHGQKEFTAALALGQKVRLCGDPNFMCVVVSIEFRLGKTPMYLLKWRDCRGFTEAWMNAAEIAAIDTLDE